MKVINFTLNAIAILLLGAALFWFFVVMAIGTMLLDLTAIDMAIILGTTAFVVWRFGRMFSGTHYKLEK